MAENRQVTNILIFIFIYSILAAGWDLVFGYMGQVNLGPIFPLRRSQDLHSPNFFHTSINPLVNLFVSGMVAGIGNMIIIGLPSLRFRGNYFALVTLAFTTIAESYAIEQLEKRDFRNTVYNRQHCSKLLWRALATSFFINCYVSPS